MLCKETTFHSDNQKDFEDKLENGGYSIQRKVLDEMTLESIMFMCCCLQYDEHSRAGLKFSFSMTLQA